MAVVTFTLGTRLGPYEILSARDLPGLGEVYDARRRISAGGGSWSRWLADGGEIVYLDLENRLVAVPVKGAGSELDVGSARPLFQIRTKPNRGYPYDLSADGQRLLVNLSP